MKKIIGIFVCLLLIATAIPVVGIKIDSQDLILVGDDRNDEKFPTPFFGLLKGADQKQLIGRFNGGYNLIPQTFRAQSFKPSKDKIDAVALWIYKIGSPPDDQKITVSIRDDLNGKDLAARSIRTDQIFWRCGGWIVFNLNDITVIPDNTYYIVCSSDQITSFDKYAWRTSWKDFYDRGDAWRSSGSNWYKLIWYDNESYIDFCFITYYEAPRIKEISNPFILQLLEQFPLLQKVFLYLIK